MNADKLKALAGKVDLIRQLCMAQLPTAHMANVTLHMLLRDVVEKSMVLRDEILAMAEVPVEKPKRKPKKKAEPKPEPKVEEKPEPKDDTFVPEGLGE